MAREAPPAPSRGARQGGPRISDRALFERLLDLSEVLGPMYGSSTLPMLLHALVRRERSRTIVELGAGLGVTSFWLAAAVKQNGAGRVWSIDDASHFATRDALRSALEPLLARPSFAALRARSSTYRSYFRAASELLGVGPHFSLIHDRIDWSDQAALDAKRLPFMAQPIDLLFADIRHDPTSILDLLACFLPHMNECASIFIDSASTLVSSFLALERVVEQLGRSKIPQRFLEVSSPARRKRLLELVPQRRFTLVHLTERRLDQNGTAWLRIEPNDIVPHPITFMRW